MLERVAQGEEIAITKHGKPVARLVPFAPAKPKPDVRKAVEDMKRFQKEHGPTLGPKLIVRELIEEGRRF